MRHRGIRPNLLHGFRCARQLVLQNDLSCFIQNAVRTGAISQIHTNAELRKRFHTRLHGADLLDCRSFFVPCARPLSRSSFWRSTRVKLRQEAWEISLFSRRHPLQSSPQPARRSRVARSAERVSHNPLAGPHESTAGVDVRTVLSTGRLPSVFTFARRSTNCRFRGVPQMSSDA